MSEYEILCPCHFGLEAVLKREIYDLGYEITNVSDGRVTFAGDAEAIALANIKLRTAERVLLVCGSFHAETFEDFFQGVKAIHWEEFIPKDGKFWVKKAAGIHSKLFSASDLQSIAKKAMVERLKGVYQTEWFEETGDEYPVRVFINKDEATIALDTTGATLHKRGYRIQAGAAPISETLAAALILLTPWRKDRILLDPMCGSGTFPIEAALIAANIAPGLNRGFTAENWPNIVPKEIWDETRKEAKSEINTDIETDICGCDIDPEVLEIARENAKRAGVAKLVKFKEMDMRKTTHPGEYGFIITNPPYGERLEEKKDLPELYYSLGQVRKRFSTWSMFMITSYENALKDMRLKPDKNRKIDNGTIKTYFYQFLGPKPPREKREQ
jgi:putative N6-adenine-specific DNA methylase